MTSVLLSPKGVFSVLVLLAMDTVDHFLILERLPLTLAALSLSSLCAFPPLPGPDLLEFPQAESRVCLSSPSKYCRWVIMRL